MKDTDIEIGKTYIMNENENDRFSDVPYLKKGSLVKAIKRDINSRGKYDIRVIDLSRDARSPGCWWTGPENLSNIDVKQDTK